MAEEGGHWYTPEGTLVATQPYADKKRAGESRQTTLRDARRLGLLPSVTTVLGILDRPGLRAWRIKWAIEIALSMPGPTPEEVLEATDSYVEWAAAQGTKVHLGLSEHLQGRTIAIEPEIDEIVREFWPWYATSGLHIQRSEHPIVSPLGYAGTVDYLGTYEGDAAIVDFKTQDFEVEKQALFYDEHALQLSGYAIGAGMADRKRLSVIISRTTPGLVAFHDWSPEAARWDSAWLNLWALWQDLKNYYPRRLFDVDSV